MSYASIASLPAYAKNSGGTVTSLSVVTANGVSGTVATPTTTPAITITLGAIAPSSVAAVGTVTGSNLSGTNTGNQDLSGLQPLDGDLTALAALTGTDTIYYRSGVSAWSAVTIGTGLDFTAGTLTVTGGGTYTDEQAQDAVGTIFANTDTINLTYIDATPSIFADVKLQMSIASDASGIKLSGDAANPGNTKLYGTNGAGSKGWYDQPVDTIYTDEMAQDAVGATLTNTTTVNLTYNDGANTIDAAVIYQMSITADASGLKLVGDAAAPGNCKLYGTDGAGAKGWYAQPAKQLFDHYADAGSSGTTETDLYSDSVAGSTLGANGDKLAAEYGVTLVNSTSTKRVQVYFGGTSIFDTGALTISASSEIAIDVTIIRKNSTTVRYKVTASTTGASTSSYANVGELGSLTLSSANVLKVTGQAGGVGAANNDVLAVLGTVSWEPAA